MPKVKKKKGGFVKLLGGGRRDFINQILEYIGNTKKNRNRLNNLKKAELAYMLNELRQADQ